MKLGPLATLACLACVGAATAAAAATPADRAFVAKVSQGGMFEVEAAKLAQVKAAAIDVRDFAVMEAHDHVGVGDRLTAVASAEGLTFPKALNAPFSAKLAHLKMLSGPAFDAAYMDEMAQIHAADGAAFAKEGAEGGSAAFRAFGMETHRIVQRHIGAIHAAPPPVR